MMYVLLILLAALWHLNSNTIGIMAMDSPNRIPLLTGPNARPSQANVAHLELVEHLSQHGKASEHRLSNARYANPEGIGEQRALDLWFDHGHAELRRNDHQHTMNMHSEDIQALEKSKKKPFNKLLLKVPLVSKVVKKRENILHGKFNEAKQQRDEQRQIMRGIASDAQIHKNAGNFVDHDVRYVIQENHGNSIRLGFRADGRHISSLQNSPTSSPRQSSPKLSKSSSGPSRGTTKHERVGHH